MQVNEVRFCGLGPGDASFRPVPNMFGNNPLNDFVNNEGTVSQTFQASDGFYQVVSPVVAPNSASNSFYIRIDGGPWMLWDQMITGAGRMTTQAVAINPGIVDRRPEDFFCWKIKQGQTHSLSLRWRELGAFVGPLLVTPDLPALRLVEVSGCTLNGGGCPTEGGNVLSLSMSGLCALDVKISVGGRDCMNITTSSAFPNRIATCVLPAGRGGIVPVSVESAGRRAELQASVKYATPRVLNITGCAGGSTCKPGETITIHGSNFGVSGAEVLVLGNPCASVVHDPASPHTRLVCTISREPSSRSVGLEVRQGGSSSEFLGVFAQGKVVDAGVVTGAVLGGAAFLALAGALYVWARRRAQRARESRRLMNPEPWRIREVSKISSAPTDDGLYSCIIGGQPAWLYTLKGVALLRADSFFEAVYKTNLPALSEILGVYYRSPTQDAMAAFRGGGAGPAPIHTTLRGVLESPDPDIALVVGNLAQLAKAASLLHSSSIELPSSLALDGSVMLRDGSGDEAEAGSGLRLRATYSPYLLAAAVERGLAGRTSSESAGVIRFGKYCCAMLGSDASGVGEEGTPGRGGRDGSARLKAGGQSPAARYLGHSTRSNVNLTSGRSVTSFASSDGHEVGPLGLNELVPTPLNNLLAAAIKTKNKSRPTFGVISELLSALERELAVTKLVEIRTEELRKANKRSDELLSRMIPALYLPLVRENKHIPAQRYPDVSVFFCDIVSFTTMSSLVSPEEVVSALDQYIAALDALSLQYGLTRVNTIGDAYFAVCGAPAPVHGHCVATVSFARDAIKAASQISIGSKKVCIRVGIHTGVVAGGIQGGRIPRFDVFGDTVNTASRMESSGTPGRINMTEEAFKIFEGQGGRPLGAADKKSTDIKGKGVMTTVTID